MTQPTSIRYFDTRGQVQKPVEFSEAVITGLAPGGGLFVPERIPELTLDEICGLADMPYHEQAAFVYRRFGVNLDDVTLNECMRGAYGEQFDTDEICLISSIDDNTHILELWHGPTSAFKDMALRCLPRTFQASVIHEQRRGTLEHDFVILVATSGDTGKAALAGFADVPGIDVCVMYPDGGVSDIQRKQMATQRGENVMVWALRGNFDDCQRTAKQVFGDEAFARELLDTRKKALSSANSINWGRLLPQVVYYISSYARLVKQGKIAAGDLIDVCVPTGNFGNILASWYAKHMGVPIERMICASNENNVLSDFINTGTYDISNRAFTLTPSPSMDILVSSNLERQLFELTGRDEARISQWMRDLREQKRFQVDRATFAALREEFSADFCTNIECFETIQSVYETHHYLMDPHTAVAFAVAQRCRGENPVLVASTAHWAKFGADVYRALKGILPGRELPSELQKMTGCEINELVFDSAPGCAEIPAGLTELDDLPLRFTEVIDAGPASVEQELSSFLARNEG